MPRQNAINRADIYFESGAFRDDLARRIAIRTESQNNVQSNAIETYLDRELTTTLESLGFKCSRLESPTKENSFLFAERIENERFPTIFLYLHGDVVAGMDEAWEDGLSPWQLHEKNNRYYGRGTADNKGQHSINLAALRCVLEERGGKLNFNVKILAEMGEEIGSPGLHNLCKKYRDLLASDFLLASDGPRLQLERPTIFLGCRGTATMELSIHARDSAHHSGNWGGLLANPAIQLAQALATITTSSGEIKIPEWRPSLPSSVRDALEKCGFVPAYTDADWGEPGLTPAEKLFGWCSFEILAMTAGNPANPVGAIPPDASATVQLRFVVGVEPDDIAPALRRHFDEHGFGMVAISAKDNIFLASRVDPDHPLVEWAAASLKKTTSKDTAILPNIGASLPNDAFSDILGLPTIWVPHSYPGCSQHAPNEHLPLNLVQEALQIMSGLYWDIGEDPETVKTLSRSS